MGWLDVGVRYGEESSVYEPTYLETDLSTGECRDIALTASYRASSSHVPPAPAAAAAASQWPVSAGVSGSSQTLTAADSHRPPTVTQQHDVTRTTQQLNTNRYTASMSSSDVIREPRVTARDDVRSSDESSRQRDAPRDGVYSVASSRTPHQSATQRLYQPTSATSRTAADTDADHGATRSQSARPPGHSHADDDVILRRAPAIDEQYQGRPEHSSMGAPADEERHLTAEEQQRRHDMLEKYRKLVAAQRSAILSVSLSLSLSLSRSRSD